MVKTSHYFPRNMLQDISEQALKQGVSDSDIVRMAIKEYCKKHKGD